MFVWVYACMRVCVYACMYRVVYTRYQLYDLYLLMVYINYYLCR